MILIQASSSGYEGGNCARITVNDSLVAIESNEHGHYRGLHIAIINPRDGLVQFAKVFDTYETSTAFDAFTNSNITEGHIIVAACKDDFVNNLSENGKQWFANMGSKEIWNVQYRQGFTFIGLSGKNEAHEKRATRKEDQVSITDIFKSDANASKQSKPNNPTGMASPKLKHLVANAVKGSLDRVKTGIEMLSIGEESHGIRFGAIGAKFASRGASSFL